MFELQTRYRDLFWEWCQENNIVCEYQGTHSYRAEFNYGYDFWYIGNEKDRMLAILRWS